MMIDTIYAQIAGDRRQELLIAARERRLTRRARGLRTPPVTAGSAAPAASLAQPAAC